MAKGLFSSLSGPMKTGILVAGGLAVVGTGAVIYIGMTSDKGFGVFLPDELTETAKEQVGCCLPNCESKKEAECTDPEDTTFTWNSALCEELDECKEGCCYPHGNLPKAACDHIAGPGVWQDGECKGFKVKTSGTTNHTFTYGGAGEWIYTLDVYSCDEDPYNATWTGSWHIDYYYANPGGGKGLAEAPEGNVSLTTSGGKGSFSMEGQMVDVTVDSTTMTTSYYFDEIGKYIGSMGTIVMDDSKCQ